MKSLKPLMIVVTILIAGLSDFKALAQNVKQNEPPSWAPAYGTRTKESVRYYYFPDISAYYDVTKNHFIAWNGGKWTISPQLPAAHKNLDLQAARKVILDFTGENPHYYFQKHQKEFPKENPAVSKPAEGSKDDEKNKDDQNKESKRDKTKDSGSKERKK
jgi:hypothetical protein